MPSPVDYREAPPARELAPFVRRYWTTCGRAVGAATWRVLPDGCADVLFDLAAATAEVVGTMTRPLAVPHAGDVDVFGIRFAPGGLHALAGVPLHPFTDGAAPLDDADPLLLAPLAAELTGRPFEARAAAADRALLDRVRARAAAPPALAPLLARLERAPSLPRVARLAADVGVAERTLERRFREAVGVGPKLWLRWLRFDRARALLAAGRSPGEAGAALYADQAHLAHEFRSFAGEPPGEWLARRRALSDSYKTPAARGATL